MRLIRYDGDSGPLLGLVEGGSVYALQGAGSCLSDICRMEHGRLLDLVRKARSAAPVRKESVRLLNPIPRAGKIICLGLNYIDHAAESGHAKPEFPVVFLRAGSSMAGPQEPMIRPKASTAFDYEAELVAIIGTECRHATPENALDFIFGYTIFNDGSIRDYQRKSSQWTLGKNFDRTGAIGPEVVTADALPPGAAGLRISAALNGMIVQDASTDDMIFPVAKTISILSQVMTLEPGDIIAMGTPSGVGQSRKPPLWLKPGDRIDVSVEAIGVLSSRIVDES